MVLTDFNFGKESYVSALSYPKLYIKAYIA